MFYRCLLYYLILFFSCILLAQGQAGEIDKGATLLDEDDIKVGRFGEQDDVPEGFNFSKAEDLLWLSDHFENLNKPVKLYYEFEKSGSYEDGFNDSVYLEVTKINNDGSKDTQLEFFTGERKQLVDSRNLEGIFGNPVLVVYMQGDVYEMGRVTDGHWRHFQKMLKIAFRESAVVEDTTFKFNDKVYQGKRIFLSPYINDPHRSKFEEFSNKSYEFILSKDIPGNLFSIRTVVNGKDNNDLEPLMLEVLKLVEVN